MYRVVGHEDMRTFVSPHPTAALLGSRSEKQCALPSGKLCVQIGMLIMCVYVEHSLLNNLNTLPYPRTGDPYPSTLEVPPHPSTRPEDSTDGLFSCKHFLHTNIASLHQTGRVHGRFLEPQADKDNRERTRKFFPRKLSAHDRGKHQRSRNTTTIGPPRRVSFLVLPVHCYLVLVLGYFHTYMIHIVGGIVIWWSRDCTPLPTFPSLPRSPDR